MPLPVRLACASLVVVAASGPLAALAPAGGFRTTADAACGSYDRTTAGLPEITSAAELRRQLVLVPRLFRTMVDRIAATPATQAQRTQKTELVASLRQVQRILGRIRDAFLRGDKPGIDAAIRSGTAPSRTAARTARALGLPTCAHLAASSAKGPQP